MKHKIIFFWVIMVVFTLCIVEAALRIQQVLGPIYDLNFAEISMDGLSDVINHKPVEKQFAKFSNPKMYEKHNGFEYITSYDSAGIRKNSLRPNYERDDNIVSILFMGDSFIQGYDDSNTIPQHVWEFFNKNGLAVNIYNAGFMSYSPAIFIPQSKQIIPKLKPDFVVVDIDETDLGDDYVRYRKLIVRDGNGKNIAVRPSPLNYEYKFGILQIKKQFFFTVRWVMALYHTKIYMPAFNKKYREGQRSILGFSRDKSNNAGVKFRQEIQFFKENVNELAETIIALMGDNHRILFLYHPHLQHLQPDSNGRYWNRFVSTTVKAVAQAHDIAFYDASADLKKIFNGEPQKFYWKGNIHFNFEGLRRYGELVAKRLLILINNSSQNKLDRSGSIKK